MSSSSQDFPAKLVYQPVAGFIQQVASKAPAPGGGSAAALSGAVGAALLSMVTNFTIGKKNYAHVSDEFTRLRDRTEVLRSRLTALIDEDTAAFNRYRIANKLSETDEAEKAYKATELAAATQATVDVPEQTMNLCFEGLGHAAPIARDGNVNTVSDAGAGAELLAAGLEGAALNVLINLSGLDEQQAASYRKKVDDARMNGRRMLTEVRQILSEKLRG
jgi:formiminotetrahydrofolate cyclodeaminase